MYNPGVNFRIPAPGENESPAHTYIDVATLKWLQNNL